ncbi:uncharacterized protein AB9W97_011487 isoform 1-T1 [Spinachia spinachia]
MFFFLPYSAINVPRAQAPYRAKRSQEVDSEAWAHVVSEGGDTSHYVRSRDRQRTNAAAAASTSSSRSAASPSAASQRATSASHLRCKAPSFAPATSSAAPLSPGAGVSAELDEPTDEELLEASQEIETLVELPAALVVVQPAETPARSHAAAPLVLFAPVAVEEQEELPGPAFLPRRPPSFVSEMRQSLKHVRTQVYLQSVYWYYYFCVVVSPVAASVLEVSADCGAAAVDRSGAIYQGQPGEASAHQ